MMTPNDHMSHDLSYFSGPNTSGAEKEGFALASLYYDSKWNSKLNCLLTHIIRCIARGGQAVFGCGLFGESKVCKLDLGIRML